MAHPADNLRAIKTFEDLICYLEDELDWPLEQYGFEDLTFEYAPAELGLKDEDAAKVRTIHQLRPFQQGQPWGIFFIEFENKRMPVVVLRRILSHLALKKRASANAAQAAAWRLGDLLFVSAFGDEATDQREIAFAHFRQEEDGLPTLRVLGWDGGDTGLKLDYVAHVLHEQLCWPNAPDDADAWRKQWSHAFRHGLGHSIRTADALAEQLAGLARGIRDAARTLMQHESESGPLRRLHKAFQIALIHNLSEADFADTYAQTITYGLLTAAISSAETSQGRDGTGLVAEDVTDLVHLTNPFLHEILGTFFRVGGQKGGVNFDELGVQSVVEVLRSDKTDLPAILLDFNNKTRGEDPVIHFYEHFLAAYDKKLKVQRGIFYTPQPVVSYIVRSVHELLQTEFGLEDGLASIITWGEMAQRFPDLVIPEGTDPASPFVVILDPATGTATFLVEVIEVIYRTLMARWQRQRLSEAQQRDAWNEYVPRHLLPRLYGYELMMAPYAIAHMKIGLKLKETGFTAWVGLRPEDRVRVYLTNSLEPPSGEDAQLAFADWVPALAHEARAVNAVKRHQRFTVVLGNPPYSSISQNMGGQICELVNQYLVLPDGPLKEKSNRNHLQDDYVKFMRLAQELTQNTGLGLVAMITNNSYLTGAWHRGMRYHLHRAFPRIDILNLHGGKGFVRSAADEDENVFDIMQSVGVGIFVHALRSKVSVSYRELVGTREGKYERLLSGNLGDPTSLTPRESNQWIFQPFVAELQPEWNTGIGLDKVFVEWGAGVKTNRDGLAVGFDRHELGLQIRRFADLSLSDEEVESSYSFRSNYQWKTGSVRKKFAQERFRADLLTPYAYRPFDLRLIYWHSAVVFNMRGGKMECFRSATPPVAMLFSRNTTKDAYTNFFVTRTVTDIHCLETMNVASLYLLPASSSGAGTLKLGIPSRPNFHEPFVRELAARMGLPASGMYGLPQGVTPEDIFQYAYSVFHSPTYRSRYAQFLKIDFPRLPLTSSLALFRALAALGGELVGLHLMESSKLAPHITTYRGAANPEVEKVSFASGTVWLDKAQTRGFRGVPAEVWNFHIGGYQVCEKWLKDRKGRVLSAEDIEHYQRIVVALNETIRIMGEIDKVIGEHGGWPIQ